jgi:hypothetical protein
VDFRYRHGYKISEESARVRMNISQGRGSSVVEQPIRNRQVVGSTPTLGSTFSLRRSIAIDEFELDAGHLNHITGG